MKYAVAQRSQLNQPADIRRAEIIVIYERKQGRFTRTDARPVPDELRPDDTPGWLGLLRGCSGIIARAFPPRLAFELQRHRIVTLSGDGFGPLGIDDALEFLASIAQHETFEQGAGI